MMTLAPATTARVTPDEIMLTGEAYFQLQSNLGHPTVVRTTDAVVRVLGTSFVVRRYTTDRGSRVVVENGKVALDASDAGHSRQRPVVLSARTRGVVVDSGITVTTGINVDDYTAWTAGRLVFDEVPLREVVAELGRAYGVDVRIDDTLLAHRSMTLKASVQTQPLTQVLDFIGRVTQAHYIHVGTTYVLTPGRAPARVPQSQTIPQLEKEYGR